ncbi:Outer membrane protein assembly factor BamD precursor [Vibrio aerogenes CECT 7868]|uniref:Outer membrane protein assembly factor BamD n=1 Tax=Vibrio aerogenes CECT 7868 TaxID=1216006 RepID=A0A1M5Y745_9VIBR|nr:outer membrane protein assembly factor BamD [Vibrio aerogenes]SHI07749.1 Outer membrane protein assembly factor BamD precursor [Vibrio aerogenes CECT 7868]
MKHQALLSLLALTLFMTGCSSKKTIVPDMPPSQLYSDAQTSLQEGKWNRAIEKLEAMDSRYPFGPYSNQVQLDLIYVYYKNGDLSMALATIDRFIRLNPTHKKMDWVLYMRGLTNSAQDTNYMHELFNTDRSDRDPEPVEEAFGDFKKLVKRYPDSLYANDARQRMFSLKKRLAKYELATADFYLRREAWIAAIKRCQELQNKFPGTEAARESLEIQAEAYKQLGLEDAEKRTRHLIGLNPA